MTLQDLSLITHEPEEPQNWPAGHVRVDLSNPEDHECVRVWIHGHLHFLHATTARELAKELEKCLAEYNQIVSSASETYGVIIPEV